MEYRSNITIASNIFNRVNNDIKQDPDFIHNCRGNVALRALEGHLFGSNVGVKLTKAQEKELKQGRRCSQAKDGQVTHGAIKKGNDLVFGCRCEYVDCHYFIQCMPNPIVRVRDDLWDTELSVNSQTLEYDRLGAVEKIIAPLENSFSEAEEETIPTPFFQMPTVRSSEYKTIENHEAIILADLDTHILVNAGPGTGKTYSVIERLTHIIHSGKADLSQMLVLCYTKTARDVILQRLTERGLGAEARQMVICTFDSLAWSNLEQKTDTDLFSLGFNGCIALFNSLFEADEWTEFEYVIIDELQDLVNERAKMTLNILSAVQCGYLLLGDKCQAIYDYDCDGIEKLDSEMFYECLNALLPPDAIKYELLGNHRQSSELARHSNELRQVLLEFGVSDVNEYFEAEIQSAGSKTLTLDDFLEIPQNETRAILTRKNGEAEWISSLLHRKNIPHSLLRSVTPRVSLHRWIADLFWDYREPRISRCDFIERYIVRINEDQQTAERAFNAIISSLSAGGCENAEYFELEELAETLKRRQDLSAILLNESYESLTVSTIHKAKGREFDHVYLLSGFSLNSENTEEARIWYVGATRPKMSLTPVKPFNLFVSKPTPMNRRMITGMKYGCTYCRNIVVGLPDDVDPVGFISGDLTQALKTQQYIATQVQVNDNVEFVRDRDTYSIFHKKTLIGRLNPAVSDDFWAAIRMTGNKNNIPPRLLDVYVNHIVTVVPFYFPSGVDVMFKESKFWLGVELTGFAKADWHWERSEV